MKKVCVVVPAYNEGTVIKQVIKKSKKIFSNNKNYKIDIVVINDGSKDSTSSEAKAGGAIVVDHILNSGYGGALSTGLNYAKKLNYDIAATMDADGQHAPQDVLNCIKNLDKNDIDLLIGSRMINSKGMSRTKIIGNKGLTLITKVLFGVNVTDSQSGLRVYSKKALQSINYKSTGMEFSSEIIWRAKQAKLKISEYPIKAIYTDYSISKGQNNWNAINIVKNLITQRFAEIFN